MYISANSTIPSAYAKYCCRTRGGDNDVRNDRVNNNDVLRNVYRLVLTQYSFNISHFQNSASYSTTRHLRLLNVLRSNILLVQAGRLSPVVILGGGSQQQQNGPSLCLTLSSLPIAVGQVIYEAIRPI